MQKTNVQGVYMITCLVNKKSYIGSSKNCRQRISTHKEQLKYNYHYCKDLQLDYNLYGLNMFSFNLIEETKDYKKREIELQLELKTTINEFGYNIKLGDYITNSFVDGNRRRSSGKPVLVIDKDLKTITEFETPHMCAALNNIKPKRLSSILLYWKKPYGSTCKESKTTNNKIFIYKDQFIEDFDYINFKLKKEKKEKIKILKNKEEYITTAKKIKLINKETNEELIFNSITEAIEKLKLTRSKVCKCLKNKKYSHHNFIFEYL